MRAFLSARASVFLALVFSAGLALFPTRAQAVVEITFYSHESGVYFPHTFITLTGVDDRTGQRINVNYGFTTPDAGPAVFSGPVPGVLEVVSADYIASSTPHFSVPLTSQQVASVRAVAEKWRRLPQPSYELWTQNCVVFVAEIAARLGMAAEVSPDLVTQPSGYLQSLASRNLQWLTAKRARFHLTPL